MKSKKTIKKGGSSVDNICIQADLFFIEDKINIKIDRSTLNSDNLYDAINKILDTKKIEISDETDTEEIKKQKEDRDILKIKTYLGQLSSPSITIFDDIVNIVKNYDIDEMNFQSKIFDKKDVFTKYQLWNKEDQRKFITIDPTIVQIMVFDDDVNNNDDIVYSLKLIIREKGNITFRYTTQLFPYKSKITNFSNLDEFNNFNLSLGNLTINQEYQNQLINFLKNYIKFYNFYKKCYYIDDNQTKLSDYQLKYISILGKARFGYPNLQIRTAIVTDYIMSNLLFTSPTYAFISGGYRGFKSNKYGVTRSGYEIAKKYNRPILTIMCSEGKHDAHEYSDSTLIYGEHWGEDSIALSQLTDGAIIIAPFGGWTYIECLTLLANKKIVAIYNDLYNILNYSSKNKSENLNFFKFTPVEQDNIINYYINYYLLLIYLLKDNTNDEDKKFIQCLTYEIQILSYLKKILPNSRSKYDSIILKIESKIDELRVKNSIRLSKENGSSSSGKKFVRAKSERLYKENNEDKKQILKGMIAILKNNENSFEKNNQILFKLISLFNLIKNSIDKYLDNGINLEKINREYKTLIQRDIDYQNNIPKKCDGIWIKPIFDLINICIKEEQIGGGILKKHKGGCEIKDDEIIAELSKFKININNLDKHKILDNLNTNILFVFSDVMYLNIYLNEHLNTVSFQKELQKKIASISRYTIPGNKSTEELLFTDSQLSLKLDKSLDGKLLIDLKKISLEHKIRKEYSFIINNNCNNYESIIKPKGVNPMIGEIGKSTRVRVPTFPRP